MSSRAAICAIEPGMLTTIQDLGRPGCTGIGVGRGGAADPLSLRIGNRLVGNTDGAAAFEMTLTGGTFEFNRDSFVVLSGGAVNARIEGREPARPAVGCLPIAIHSGERLVIGPIRTGVRSYLCVAGGVDVPLVLGSRSTHLVGAFGGLAGRAIRAGDLIDVGDKFTEVADLHVAERALAFCNSILARHRIRAVDGAHRDTFDAKAIELFWTSEFEVSVQSDRTGLRLIGQVGRSTLGGRMASEGMMQGAVQVPESGEPIVLMVDHPTTGGYPVIACVAAVDHCVLGQLRPRERIRFESTSLSAARGLYTEQEKRLDAEVPPR